MTGFIPNGFPPTQGAAVPNSRPPSRFGGVGSPLNASRVKAGGVANRIRQRSGETASKAQQQAASMSMGVVALAGGNPSPMGQGGMMGLPMGGLQTGFPSAQPDPNAEFRNTIKGIGQEALQGAVERAAKGQSVGKTIGTTFKDAAGKAAAATGDNVLKTRVGVSDADKRAEILENLGDRFSGGKKPSSTDDADEAGETKKTSTKDKTSKAVDIAAGLATSEAAATGTSVLRAVVTGASTTTAGAGAGAGAAGAAVTTAAAAGATATAGISAGAVAAGAAAVVTAGGLFYALKQRRKRKREAQQDLPPAKEQKTSETPSEDTAVESTRKRPKRGGIGRTRRSRRPAAGSQLI